MAYFPHAFQKMLIHNGSAIAVQNTHPKDLTAGQIAFVDAKTNLAIISPFDYQYTSQMYIAQGSYHTTDKIGPYHGGYKESVKTKGINPKYVSAFYLTEPAAPLQDIITICVTPGCEIACNQTHRLRVDIKGSPALRFLTHNVYYTLDAWTGCCDALVPPSNVDPNIVLLQWADQINNYPTTQPFIRARVLGTSLVAGPITAAAPGSVTLTNRTGVKIGDKITFTPTTPPSSAGATIVGNIFTAVGASTSPFTVGMVLTGTGVATGTTITGWISGNGSSAGSSFQVSISQTVAATAISSTSPATMFVASTYVGPQTTAGAVPVSVAATLATPVVPEVLVGAIATGATTPVTVQVALSTATYTPLVGAAADTVNSCLEIVGAYVDTVFQDCSFSPLDHVEYQPVELYASVSVLDVLGYQCAAKCYVITETQQAVQGKGFGETLIRELILAKRYLQEPWIDDPRYREVMDYNPFAEITRGNKYYVYHILHSVPRKSNPTGVMDNDQYLIKIVTPTRQPAFETAFSAYLVSAGNRDANFVVLP